MTTTEPSIDRLNLARRDHWRGWQLDERDLTLDLFDEPTGNLRYQVDLERCLTSAEVLDWICQVARKRWADDATLAGLVRALKDVLKPQANLCSFGHDRSIDDVEAVVEKFTDRASA